MTSKRPRESSSTNSNKRARTTDSIPGFDAPLYGGDDEIIDQTLSEPDENVAPIEEACYFSDDEEVEKKHGRGQDMGSCFVCHFYSNKDHYNYDPDALKRFEQKVLDSEGLKRDFMTRCEEAAKLFVVEIIEPGRANFESEVERRLQEGIDDELYEFPRRITGGQVAEHFSRHVKIVSIMLERNLAMQSAIMHTIYSHHARVKIDGNKKVIKEAVEMYNKTNTSMNQTVKTYKDLFK
jgi:hypothetical protein